MPGWFTSAPVRTLEWIWFCDGDRKSMEECSKRSRKANGWRGGGRGMDCGLVPILFRLESHPDWQWLFSGGGRRRRRRKVSSGNFNAARKLPSPFKESQMEMRCHGDENPQQQKKSLKRNPAVRNEGEAEPREGRRGGNGPENEEVLSLPPSSWAPIWVQIEEDFRWSWLTTVPLKWGRRKRLGYSVQVPSTLTFPPPIHRMKRNNSSSIFPSDYQIVCPKRETGKKSNNSNNIIRFNQ